MHATATPLVYRPRTLVLVLIAAALGAILGLGLAAAHGAPAAAAPAPVQPLVLDRIDAVPAPAPDVDPALLAAAFGPGADYTDAQVAEVALSADRVCEAVTAAVPADVQVITVMRESGMLPEQARTFVDVAAAGCTAVRS